MLNYDVLWTLDTCYQNEHDSPEKQRTGSRNRGIRKGFNSILFNNLPSEKGLSALFQRKIILKLNMMQSCWTGIEREMEMEREKRQDTIMPFQFKPTKLFLYTEKGFFYEKVH